MDFFENLFMDGSPTPYFYLYVSIIHDLRVLISFMSFKAEFLTTDNVAPSQITPNVWGIIRVF